MNNEEILYELEVIASELQILTQNLEKILEVMQNKTYQKETGEENE